MQSRIEIHSATALLCYADFFTTADSLVTYQQLTDCGLAPLPDRYSFHLLMLNHHRQWVTHTIRYAHRLIAAHMDVLFESNYMS
ncbi:hypothetical protein KTO58_05065 [Chitinophaga pendula]|uniref:hypothetical protein n=1 Tax=Chitinophaga TaxID=79328 RepID=UPI000BAF1FE6|nr:MULTISPECIES: hypothetical protein [Chitinophaga]ASZ13817.1 hypothetical protein CK934_24105 [Chitinophaga sp. MD30]UCJ08562.1 hypothetical protein KTO58_05065 [Chitinophaga pendula]